MIPDNFCPLPFTATLFETIVQSANDGVIITKAELNNPGPEIVYVNEAFTRISGYTRDEVIGRSPRMLQGELTCKDTLSQIGRCLRQGNQFKGELLNYHKSGLTYWLDISIVPIYDEAGVITHYAAIEREISDRKEAEELIQNTMRELKRANLKAEAATRDLEDNLSKAEAANLAKSDFLANMSHELRTPMNGVLGMAQLLVESSLNTDQKEMVETINQSAENLLHLLNDILDFSKIEARALELEDAAFDVGQAITHCTNLLRSSADKKGLRLSIETDSTISSYIWGDSARICQIITNLLGNAIKFTDKGGVQIRIALDQYHEGDYLFVSVEDTGMGIKEDKLSSIFEKFTQADTSVTRKYGGTGLGLAITKQLVHLMGGEIGVTSAEGVGSTFWFRIPYRPAQPSDVLATAELLNELLLQPMVRKPIGQIQALLVDDHDINRLFAQKLLKKFGLKHIDIAEDGAEAVMKSYEKQYDVIFMDCQMPKMDGYIATGEIRLRESLDGTHVPIIAMTANAMVGDREKCLNAGMDHYLSKPLRAAHLKHALEHWFELEESAPIMLVPDQTIEIAKDNEPPVDRSQLEVFTDGDPEEERELVVIFLQQAEEMIALLAKSIEGETCDIWKSAAHRLKGAAGNLGANRLYKLCQQAEANPQQPSVAKQALVQNIRDESIAIRHFLHGDAKAS